MKKLLWITDAHLEHLSQSGESAWFQKLAEAKADMLLLGGDTANSRIFSRMLRRIQDVFRGKIALVAGNHDYYHSSIAEFRSELACLQRAGALVFEPNCQSEPLEIAEGVYLCGSGGWGDATAGSGNANEMPLNDENFIAELKTRNLSDRLRELGKESAMHLGSQLASVPDVATSVIILTHVPPWPEACWHEGRRSDSYALPRFCWQAGGNVIFETSNKMPQTKFIVLCGHTHSDGVWQNGNITCHTAGSDYGRVAHSGMINIENTVSFQEIDRRGLLPR